jgi:hypothetical protein
VQDLGLCLLAKALVPPCLCMHPPRCRLQVLLVWHRQRQRVASGLCWRES